MKSVRITYGLPAGHVEWHRYNQWARYALHIEIHPWMANLTTQTLAAVTPDLRAARTAAFPQQENHD